MITRPDHEAETLFAMVMRIGGEDNYTESTKSAIWAECRRNPKLRNLALLYLTGSSHRATLNRERLEQAIHEVFFTDPVTGESRL